jgi:hypothetical protein
MGQKIGKALLVDIAQPFSNRKSLPTYVAVIAIYLTLSSIVPFSAKAGNLKHVAGV